MFTLRDGRNYLYAWDLNRQIMVDDPSITEVHFSNRTDDRSLVVEVKDEDGLRVANIPNIILQQPWDIIAYAYCPDSYTKIEEVLEVKARPKPDDYIYTETEVYTVEEYLARAIDEAKASGEFNGEKGDKGDPGERGPQGPTGPQGPQGEPGAKEVFYFDASAVGASWTSVPDDFVAVLDRLKNGEHIAVYIRDLYAYAAADITVAVNNTVYFILHYSDWLDNKTKVIQYIANLHNGQWNIKAEKKQSFNYATEDFVTQAIQTALSGIAQAEGGAY